MARVKVFDTNAMIAVSQGKLAVAPSTVHVVISFITRIELLSWPDLSARDLAQVQEMVDAVEVAQLTTNIEDKVIALRQARLLKLPDAIIAATALVRNAVLVTNDASFNRVSGLTVEGF